MVQIAANELEGLEAYKLLIGCVVPRPIAWVSTINSKGMPNLAPFSFFTIVSTKPPKVGITFLPDHVNKKKKKDTLVNMEEVKQFVINIVDSRLAQQMVQSSYPYPYGIDEFVQCGLTKEKCEEVDVPRIGEAYISMECILDNVTSFGEDGSYFAIGEILRFHIHDDLVIDGRKVDQRKFSAIGRMGGPLYTKTAEIFKLTANPPQFKGK